MHFRKNTVKQKLAYAGHVVLVVLMLYWFYRGEVNWEENKRPTQKNMECHGQITLYSGCRRKSMTKLTDCEDMDTWRKKTH